ncbi:MAG: hypothetical protein ABR524_07525 [Thermoanaerobaculia bacterium]
MVPRRKAGLFSFKLRGDGEGDVEQKLVAIAERYGIEPEGDRPIPEQK